MGDKGFHELGQGIHARRCGLPGRQGYGKLRIDDRQIRDHARRAQADLDPVFAGQEHGVGRDLGAGARRGRHRDHGYGRTLQRHAASDHLQVVEEVARVADERGQSLARIKDASAAHRHNHVAPRFAGHGGLGGDAPGFRLAPDGDRMHGVHDGVQFIQQPIATLGPSSGHQQAMAPQTGRLHCDVGADAKAKDNACSGKGK